MEIVTVKLKGGGIGSPKWRKAGRPEEMPEPQEGQPVDLSDLEGLGSAELKVIAERDALKALIAQARSPTRHATAVVSAAGKLLEFSSSKPAASVELTGANGGPVESRHTIRFVDPKEQG